MSNVLTPRVTEILPVPPSERHSRADAAEELRKPRSKPYNRPQSQRDWVRMSLEFDVRQHDVYPDRKV